MNKNLILLFITICSCLVLVGSQTTDHVWCPLECSGNGVCMYGECLCDQGHYGTDCSQTNYFSCPNNCSGNGMCDRGICTCNNGYSGYDCSNSDNQSCPNNCNGNGYCENGNCICNNGYYGPFCSESIYFSCPNACSGNGYCDHGQCICSYGHYGYDCSQTNYFSCPNNCNNHGYCNYGECICYNGYSGYECQNGGKVVCEQTENGIKVSSSFNHINCTISGYGKCTDILGKSVCTSNGYYSEAGCSALQRGDNIMSCTGDHIECVSSFATCSINKNGAFQANGIKQDSNVVEITELSDKQSSTSPSLIIVTYLLFVTSLLILLL